MRTLAVTKKIYFAEIWGNFLKVIWYFTKKMIFGNGLLEGGRR